MKHYLQIILFLFTICGYSQKDWQPAFEIAGDTAVMMQLPKSRLQYFVEKEGKPLSFNDVLKPESQVMFQALTDTSTVTIPPKNNIWLRYRIKNTTGKPLGITIPEGVGRANVYIAGPAGQWSHFETGTDIPHSKRDGYKRIRQIPYTIPAHAEIMVYEKNFDSSRYIMLSVMAGIEKNVIREYFDNDDYLLQIVHSGVLFGFFIFGAVFNFFFFSVVREKVYFVYGLLLFFIAVSFFSEPLVILFFKDQPWFRTISDLIGNTVTFSFFVMTALLFLQASRHHPRWNNLLMVLTLVFCFINVYRAFFDPGNNLIITIIWIVRFAMLLGVLGILVAGLIKKRHFAGMLALAMLPFILLFVLMLTRIGNFGGYTDIAVVWAILVLSWSLFQRYKFLQAENTRQAIEKEQERNALIAQQNEMLEHQVAERTSELTQSLAELKQTQNQLIQSEKMASLGELTAGIAHEIQNPLNFVNNFSDVSIELLDEMGEELDKGDTEEAKAIADDIKLNLEKISHHGKRADGIVKGMLQHSRASSGQKEQTDINALADEYLRLAYHGLRAKDKSFNAELVTNFDENLPKINVIPQDIGRVLLNLFTNAFYATQKKSQSQSQFSGGAYKPTVTVTTLQKGNSVEIIVKDNGIGIPDAIKDKILQPFFTTKPTGEGTGLGLSLSYDIVVKGHGGSIAIESEEGVFTTFTVTLPT